MTDGSVNNGPSELTRRKAIFCYRDKVSGAVLSCSCEIIFESAYCWIIKLLGPANHYNAGDRVRVRKRNKPTRGRAGIYFEV